MSRSHAQPRSLEERPPPRSGVSEYMYAGRRYSLVYHVPVRGTPGRKPACCWRAADDAGAHPRLVWHEPSWFGPGHIWRHHQGCAHCHHKHFLETATRTMHRSSSSRGPMRDLEYTRPHSRAWRAPCGATTCCWTFTKYQPRLLQGDHWSNDVRNWLTPPAYVIQRIGLGHTTPPLPTIQSVCV